MDAPKISFDVVRVMKNSVLCLLSGGIDSTVMVKHYLDKDWDVTGFFVEHYQPTGETERVSVGEITRWFHRNNGSQFQLKGWGHVATGFKYDGYFGPFRNTYLLSLAINNAYHLKIKNIAIGLCRGEYLDTRPEFIDRFNFMQEYCLKKPIWVLAPFSNWSSERVIKYGLKIGAPLNLTTSCMETPACGKCPKCRLRKKYGIDPRVEIGMDLIDAPEELLERRIKDNPIVPL